MSGSYIATTTEDDVQWLMAAGQSLGLSVAQLRHHLAQTLSPAHGALLAEPVEDVAGRATDWYGAGEGAAEPLEQLPPGPRAAMTTRVWALLRDIKAEGVRLGASTDTDERVLGAMLERVSHVPDVSCVRVRGDAPVVIAWAHGRAGVSVDLSALFKPVEVPLPPPRAVPPQVARRAWPVWLVPASIVAVVALAVLWRQTQTVEPAAPVLADKPTTPVRPDAVPMAPTPPTQVTAPPSFATPAPPPPKPAEPTGTSETRTPPPQPAAPAGPETTQVTAPPSFATPAPPPPKPAEASSTQAATPALPAIPTPPPPTPTQSSGTSETRTSQAQTAPTSAPAETPPPVSTERQPPSDVRPASAPLETARVDTPPPQSDMAQLPPHESEPAPSPRPFTAAAVRGHDLGMLQGCWTLQGGFATAEIQTHKAARVSNWRTCFGRAAAGAASLGGTQLLGWEDGKSCTGPVTARFLPDDRLEIADASDCMGDRTLFRMMEQCTRKDDASMLCSWTAHDRSGGAEFRGDGLTFTPGR